MVPLRKFDKPSSTRAHKVQLHHIPILLEPLDTLPNMPLPTFVITNLLSRAQDATSSWTESAAAAASGANPTPVTGTV